MSRRVSRTHNREGPFVLGGAPRHGWEDRCVGTMCVRVSVSRVHTAVVGWGQVRPPVPVSSTRAECLAPTSPIFYSETFSTTQTSKSASESQLTCKEGDVSLTPGGPSGASRCRPELLSRPGASGE